MCGLAGMAAIGGPLGEQTHPVLERMGRAIAHRGPDGQNMMLEGPVGLVFRRLALVGPENGDQPLHSADGNVSLIANGEVYNHRQLEAEIPGLRLRTRSDCEILAHRYAHHELRFLDDVAGMFALVLWDRRRNRLIMARDRFGIKPLYYARLADSVVFASEIKALFEHPGCPRELDWPAALRDLAPAATTAPVHSWFRGVEVVPAGTIVCIDLATGIETRTTYWQLPDFSGTASEDRSDAEFIADYRDLLTASVADCASADTELGLMLSGGIDSTTVAALTADTGHRVHTFTVLTGSTHASGDSEFGARVADELGFPHHQVIFGADRTPGVDEWLHLLWLLETPWCGPEQFYKHSLYTYAKQVRPELRGMLLGQGSDEYNGGYTAAFAPSGWPGFEAVSDQLVRREKLSGTPEIGSWWEIDGVGPLLSDELLYGPGAAPDDRYPAYVAQRSRSIQQYQLWHEDRTAAGHGIEARVPFLDHRIVELVATIPRERRAQLLWDKRILRDAMRGRLPEAIIDRPKGASVYQEQAGFTLRMVVRMLAQDGGALLERALAAPGAHGVLDPAGLRAAVRGLSTVTEPQAADHVLALVNLGLLDDMVRDLPVTPFERPRYEVTGRQISHWENESRRLGAAVRRFPAPGLADRVELAPDVLLVSPLDDPGVILVSIGGSIEYVVDAAGTPDWHAFLRAVDGLRPLGEVVAAAGTTIAKIEVPLQFSLDSGVLVTRPVVAEPAGRPDVITAGV
ncbi:asparagine synthase (glutamine-hydrolyzing) [Nocardia sp. NPDC088792]|uniref:asparagine synthase (glutamine-hydrolyzing) n=1 Tax=Nocardia sp. NPDC088792 TaxID=3364332 RepID=UPI0037FAA71A